MLKMILCVDKEFGIGFNNSIPWKNKEEMDHFKTKTLNSYVVMGRRTFESIGKLLPNRKNIIFSRNKNLDIKGAIVTDDFLKILKIAKNNNVWIIGGKEIYKLFLNHVDEIILSKLHKAYNCNIFFEKKNLNFFYEYKKEKYNDFEVIYYKNATHKILNGLNCSNNLLKLINNEHESIKKRLGRNLKLSIILIGNDYASSIYVKKKIEFAKRVGVDIDLKTFKEIQEKELINLIHKLNKDKTVDGILVQTPLPKNIDLEKISENISITKDVDCFNPINFGKFVKRKNNNYFPLPCTPNGILEILKYYSINLNGKNVAIIGRSNIVGKPLINMLLNENATVTICHSKTKSLSNIIKSSDIIISAVGKSKIIKAKNIKKNSIIIDVGINRGVDNKICGDVDFANCLKKCKYITPVPGGVGPMTITMLFYNLIKLSNLIR